MFVWFRDGIHGDEASSLDVAAVTLDHLAASREAETLEWLRRTVLTIDPMLNPDGRMRYIAWLTSSVTGQPDPNPDAREHYPPWPRGRTNHFGFDMNRDWSAATQAETRARLTRLIQTPPQVVVDFHEMSPESSYFFPPVAEPTNRLLPPELFQWFAVFGKANAQAFDARGWPYFIRETFDFFSSRVHRRLAFLQRRDRDDLRDGGRTQRRPGVPAARRQRAHAQGKGPQALHFGPDHAEDLLRAPGRDPAGLPRGALRVPDRAQPRVDVSLGPAIPTA